MPKKQDVVSVTWTGEEMQILLQVVIDYKGTKTNEGFDWETIKSKYEDIAERFQAVYQKEDTVVTEEEFPNKADPQQIKKDRIISKIKRIKHCIGKPSIQVVARRNDRGGSISIVLGMPRKIGRISSLCKH